MKKIVTIAIACAGVLSFSACNDLLDESPRSSMATESLFQTQEGAEGAIYNLYRTGAVSNYVGFGSAYVNTFASLPEELTGYFTNSYENQEIQCKYSRELTRQEHTIEMASKMDGVWDDCSEVSIVPIRLSNTFLLQPIQSQVLVNVFWLKLSSSVLSTTSIW